MRTLKLFFQKKLLFPVATHKIIVLRILSIVLLPFAILFFLSFIQSFIPYSYLLGTLILYDVLTPLMVSAVVLIFQPFAVLGRNRILAQARAKRARMRNLKAVGITGSYGKTSTKEILAHVLASRFKVAKTKEHQNSEIGVSRAILDNLNSEHEV
ncbi:MAG: hypothetical protein HYV55_01175, partial [Parcubacteria group bacterium]|nr:hypothetical protein [Parcubacteria group bacterium]